MSKICRLSDCNYFSSKTSTLCSMHYARLYKYGDVHFIKQVRIKGSPKDKLLLSIKKLNNGCWVHKLGTKRGYWDLRINGKHFYAHRLSLKILGNQKLIKGLVVDHLCRTPSCINPKHLEQVTPRKNWERGITQSAQSARTNRCQKGHLFDYKTPNGTSICKICYHNRYLQRKRRLAT